jgi:hypothetical protein
MVDFWTAPKMMKKVAPMNGLEAFSEMVESIIEQMADDLFDWPWHHVEDSASSYPILVDAFRRQHNRGKPGKRFIDKRDRHWMGASE